MYDFVRTQVQDGVKTLEQLIEVDTENVTGQVERLELARLEEKHQDYFDNLFLLHEIEGLKQKYNIDLSAAFLQTPQGQTMMGAAMPAGGGMNVQTTAPPPTSPPNTGVTM